MGGHLVWRLSKTSLDVRKIKQAVVFATCEVAYSVSCQVDHHGEISKLPVQSHNGVVERKLPPFESGGNGFYATEQLPAILSVACISERAEPLMRVRMQNGGAGTHHLTAL